MAAKTNDASVKPGLVAPAVALAHLAWRPPALRLVQHLLVDRGPLTFSGLHRAESLVAWHDRQVRRYVPDPERNHPLLASNVEMARGPSFARDAAFDASRVEAERVSSSRRFRSRRRRTAREPMPAPPRDDNAGEAIAAWQPPETPARRQSRLRLRGSPREPRAAHEAQTGSGGRPVLRFFRGCGGQPGSCSFRS